MEETQNHLLVSKLDYEFHEQECYDQLVSNRNMKEGSRKSLNQ